MIFTEPRKFNKRRLSIILKQSINHKKNSLLRCSIYKTYEAKKKQNKRKNSNVKENNRVLKQTISLSDPISFIEISAISNNQLSENFNYNNNLSESEYQHYSERITNWEVEKGENRRNNKEITSFFNT